MSRNAAARLFIAVDPPEDVAEALAAWAREAARAGEGRVRANAALRVLDPELLHVTLCFLGNRPVEEIDPLAAQLADCEGHAGELSLGAPLWLPQRNPRALAIELHDEHGRLAELHARVAACMHDFSRRQAGAADRTGATAGAIRRRFHPHITVARLRSGTAPHQRTLPPTPAASFTPRELVLYRSWLSPRGASYEVVASRTLV